MKPPTINHLMLTQQLAAAVRAAQLRAETTERAAARAEAEATAAYLAAVAEPLATRQAAWDEVAEAKEAQARHCKHQRAAAPRGYAPVAEHRGNAAACRARGRSRLDTLVNTRAHARTGGLN